MVVGKKDKSDIKFKKTVDLILKGKSFENQNVYGDKNVPNRRDVFIDNKIRNIYKNDLPKTAKSNWEGKNYNSKLSFRYGKGGKSIPVYEFFI